MRKILLLSSLLISIHGTAQIPPFLIKDASYNEKKFSLKNLHKLEHEPKGIRLVSTENKTMARFNWAINRPTGVEEITPEFSLSSLHCFIQEESLYIQDFYAQPAGTWLFLYNVDGTCIVQCPLSSALQTEVGLKVSLSEQRILKGTLLIGKISGPSIGHAFRVVY